MTEQVESIACMRASLGLISGTTQEHTPRTVQRVEVGEAPCVFLSLSQSLPFPLSPETETKTFAEQVFSSILYVRRFWFFPCI